MAGLTAMSTVHAEFRTSDRKLWTGLVGFLVGSGATLAVFIWVWIKYPSPEPGWWAVFTSVHLLLHFLFLTVMAGLLFAWMLVTLLDRWYYFRGVYRCHACGRKALRGFVSCVCMPAEVQENYRRFYSLDAISPRVSPCAAVSEVVFTVDSLRVLRRDAYTHTKQRSVCRKVCGSSRKHLSDHCISQSFLFDDARIVPSRSKNSPTDRGVFESVLCLAAHLPDGVRCVFRDGLCARNIVNKAG